LEYEPGHGSGSVACTTGIQEVGCGPGPRCDARAYSIILALTLASAARTHRSLSRTFYEYITINIHSSGQPQTHRGLARINFKINY